MTPFPAPTDDKRHDLRAEEIPWCVQSNVGNTDIPGAPTDYNMTQDRFSTLQRRTLVNGTDIKSAVRPMQGSRGWTSDLDCILLRYGWPSCLGWTLVELVVAQTKS